MSAKDLADRLDQHIRQVQLWQLSRRGIIIDRVPNSGELLSGLYWVLWKSLAGKALSQMELN
jgi:hypothetical protein